MKTMTRLFAAAGLALMVAACSQKDPAAAAIKSAEDALAAVYEDAQKYVPDKYAKVKAQLDEARAAFDEERYKDAIATVKDIPARAGELASEAATAREQLAAELNADWERLSGSLPGMVGSIESRLAELGKMRRLPQGMDKQLLEEANAALASTKNAWEEAGSAMGAGNLEAAVAKARDVEGMARDLMARLGMQQSG